VGSLAIYHLINLLVCASAACTTLQGSTLKHDGSPVVLFTKQEYRQLEGPINTTNPAAGSTPVDEGETEREDQQGAGSWSRSKKKSKKQQVATGSKEQRRPTRRRSGAKQQQGQLTLDAFVSGVGQAR
jgi:hypothetical protein